MQNYLNPFNTNTEICYGLPNSDYVIIEVYNLYGQKIRTLLSQNQQAGYHTVVWDGRDETGQKVSNGIFSCKVETGKYAMTRKMLLVK